jgi:hypothetical protein
MNISLYLVDPEARGGGVAASCEFHAQILMQSASDEFVRAGVRDLNAVIRRCAARTRV